MFFCKFFAIFLQLHDKNVRRVFPCVRVRIPKALPKECPPATQSMMYIIYCPGPKSAEETSKVIVT